VASATLPPCRWQQAPETPKSTGADKASQSMATLAWLEAAGMARSTTEFREHWAALRGGMMVGAGQTVMQDKTQD